MGMAGISNGAMIPLWWQARRYDRQLSLQQVRAP